MRTRLLGILLAVVMALPLMVPAASAATRADLDRQDVFLKQSSANGTCVLVSTAMMLRRAAILQGDEDWSSINLSTVRKALPGMPHVGHYGDMTVTRGYLPGGKSNVNALIGLLDEHPEGIVLYAPCVPHGVLLTDYTDGVFYCCDPAYHKPAGRIPITEAYGTRVENSSGYWCITSHLPDLVDIEVTARDAVDRLTEALGFGEDTCSQLFGQALACHC